MENCDSVNKKWFITEVFKLDYCKVFITQSKINEMLMLMSTYCAKYFNLSW